MDGKLSVDSIVTHWLRCTHASNCWVTLLTRALAVTTAIGPASSLSFWTSGRKEPKEVIYHDEVLSCIVEQHPGRGGVDLLHRRGAEEPLTKQLGINFVCPHLTLGSQRDPPASSGTSLDSSGRSAISWARKGSSRD
ncbi:hypothetical protein B296_00049302 [Ensete ventricosum]|uniref:Uncharacterized protein n=1 Tax=Ensete ventricosum TaxID=4639 RepID=A0A426YRA3_ENSVE|nr:hypothetical protein B296_00049302 [Ensete ventricosum]